MKKVIPIIFLTLCFVLVSLRTSSAQLPFFSKKPSWEGQDYVPDEIIVKFKEGVSEDRKSRFFSRLKLRRLKNIGHIRSMRVKLPRRKTVAQMVKESMADPDVEYAEPNYIVHAHQVPDDPYFSYQWSFENPYSGSIHVQQAWDTTLAGQDVTVAILDTGVAYEDYTEEVSVFRSDEYYQAPDLAQTIFVPGYDFDNNDDHPNDDHGHGTHVAGTVAQSTNNGLGLAGIAFNAAIMPVKVLNERGSGSSFDVADGITWAVDNGADIINISLGSKFSSTTIRNACEYAYNSGVTLVCSAGNDGDDQMGYPARYNQCCIAVGATRYDEERSYYSNYGPGLDVMAPGGDLNVDQNGDGAPDGILQETFVDSTDNFGYWLFQGTSMAAPHVSGVAALLISAGVATTPDEVRAALETTAKDLGTPGWDEEFGYGLIDATAALEFSGIEPPEPTNTPPVADPAGPYAGAVDQPVNFNGSGSSDADNDPLTYSWDFGDGQASTLENPEHAYENDGNFIVSLVVHDGTEFSEEVTTTATITSLNQPPIADPGGPYTANVSEPISFDSSGSNDPDGTIEVYDWDFGDSTSSAAANPSKSYAAPGDYTVTLTVTDNQGSVHSAGTTANITEEPMGELIVFEDGFEVGEWNGLWTEDSQNDWKRQVFRTYEGDYGAEVDGRAEDAALTSIPINLQGKTNATVTFWWYIRRYFDTGEYFAFDVSTDGGTTWVEQRRLRGDVDPEDTWHNVSLTLTNIQSLRLRFRGFMDFASEDAALDNVKVLAF